jgi:CRISPR-associated protein Cmr6
MATRWQVPREVPWHTPFPLPADTAEVLMERGGACDNLSLLMNRLLAYAVGRGRANLVREFQDRRALVLDYTLQAELIAALQARWEALAQSLDALTFRASPEWRVVIGLGSNRLLEGGMTLHQTLGVPLVPASALKGVARRYAAAVAEASADVIHVLFGEEPPASKQGELIFLDGIPNGPPHLERDVMNPHYARYYGGLGQVPPADYLNPRPVFFLTIGRQSLYSFGIASATGNAAVVERGREWLQQGLQQLGIGAKTAAGYGYWQLAAEA